LTVDNGQLKITIRAIEPQDYLAVGLLWNQLGNRWVTAENIGPHYEREQANEDYMTFVALLDGQVVGLVSTVKCFSPGFDVGYMHIRGLAVTETLRSQGIGAQLLDYTENYASALGVHSIILNTGVQRTEAHKFYKRQGYDNHSWCFSKSL